MGYSVTVSEVGSQGTNSSDDSWDLAGDKQAIL